MKRRRLIDEIVLLHNRGLSPGEIADKLGLTTAQVVGVLEQRGLISVRR